MSGFSNKRRILGGAFVEYGVSAPPLFVAFQFNPEQVTRSRNLTFSVPNHMDFRENMDEAFSNVVYLCDEGTAVFEWQVTYDVI